MCAAEICRESAEKGGVTELTDVAFNQAESLLRDCIAAHAQCPIAYNNLALVHIARWKLSLQTSHPLKKGCNNIRNPASHAKAVKLLDQALELAGNKLCFPYLQHNRRLLDELQRLNHE